MFKITRVLSYLATLHELRVSCHAKRRRPIFGAKLEAWSHIVFHISHFLQSGMVFETVNPFSCIFNANASAKRCLISVPFAGSFSPLIYRHSLHLINSPCISTQQSVGLPGDPTG